MSGRPCIFQASFRGRSLLTFRSRARLVSLAAAAVLVLAASGVAAAPPDTGSAEPLPGGVSDTAAPGVRVYEHTAHPALQLVTWPIQHLLAPVVELLTYPSQEPIRYFLDEQVIDRTVDLVSFGPNDRLALYPTLSLASGTSSRVGATLRHAAPFGRDRERLAGFFSYYVNGDYRLRSYLFADSLGGTALTGKLALGVTRMKNSFLHQPEAGTRYYYSDTSESYSAQLEHPLYRGLRARAGFRLRSVRFGESPAPLQGTNELSGDFFRNPGGDLDPEYRGFNQAFLDRVWQVGLVRDSRSNEHIPLEGSWFELAWHRHDAGRDHDFHEWRGKYVKYFKLGSERYEITPEEEALHGGMSLKRIVRELEYERLRQRMFSRKVVVLHVHAARSFELPGNSMPAYGLQALGNDTPLRGYSGPRFRHYAMAAAGAEYRFPILRIMDGTLFNEYGIVGSALTNLDPADVKNSWGFGVRVRRPDMFLFRVETAFHGISGLTLNVSAATPF